MMRIFSKDFQHFDFLDPRFCLSKAHPTNRVEFSDNLNPNLYWEHVPTEAKSLVLLCVDVSVPSKPDDVNQADREVPEDLPRCDFYHWVMVGIKPSVTEIESGAYSQGVIAKGKQQPNGPTGSRQGLNDYTGWFANDSEMSGNYKGYDGPCPPWNDSIEHHYHFKLFALDIEHCNLPESFTGNDVLTAIKDHILAEAEIVGRYALNPRLTS